MMTRKSYCLELPDRSVPNRMTSQKAQADIAALFLGDFIKVAIQGNPGECFWARIVECPAPRKFIAIVDNDLFSDALARGDRIEVEEQHLYDYVKNPGGSLWPVVLSHPAYTHKRVVDEATSLDKDRTK